MKTEMSRICPSHYRSRIKDKDNSLTPFFIVGGTAFT
jgi:hypothetical protein